MFTRGQAASCTSEMEALKTSEFQTRRRERLRQVREQSKFLARTVRERASQERSRQLQRAERGHRTDYIDRQEHLVERLERVHAGAVNGIGSAHQQAAEINKKTKHKVKPTDHSEQRGKEAAGDLRRNKQQELDKKKQQLERKLTARTLANERSRLKLSTNFVTATEAGSGDANTIPRVDCNANGPKPDHVSGTKCDSIKELQNVEIKTDSPRKKEDMETQWSTGSFQQWVPDSCTPVEGLQHFCQLPNSSNVVNQAVTGKRTNLFAVSEGMPESLLGNIHRQAVQQADPAQNKPSLTLVSEFLRTRDHRLQKPMSGFHKVGDHEIQGLRETLCNSRRKERNTLKSKAIASPSRVSISSVSAQSWHALNKKRSVLHYDHATKTSRDLPLESENVVERITDKDMDAYALALKESEETVCSVKHQEGMDERRSRDSACRHRIAQEYRDTISYLQAMSRNGDGSRPIEIAYMDDYEQDKRKINFQRKLQQEFEKEAVTKPKATCVSNSVTVNDRVSKTSKGKYISSPKHDIASKTKSYLDEAEILLNQIKETVTENEDAPAVTSRTRDGIKQSGRLGNTVTFDFTPSSYTYTSRVKHTPPTRDKPYSPQKKKGGCKDENVHNVEIENIHDNDDTSDITFVSNYSSDYDVIVQTHKKSKPKFINDRKSEVRKFIVYKIKDPSDEDAVRNIKKKYKASKDKPRDVEKKNILCNGNEVEKSKKKILTCMESVLSSENSNKSEEEVFQSKEDVLEPLCPKGDSNSLKAAKKGNINECPDEIKRPLEWDIGPLPESRENYNISHSSEIQDQAIQPSASATTSATTFKTAKSDKSVASAISGGYVKILDEAGAEAGKFFIGSSNLSIDNPYEVIIQLKRKEELCSKNLQSSKPLAFKEADNVTKSSKQSAVCKSSLVRTPKRDAQFSSSSSTVYMSPPDMILPKFLKVDYRIEGEDFNIDPLKSVQNVIGDIPLAFCCRRNRVNNIDSKVKNSRKKKHQKSIHRTQSHSESSIASVTINSGELSKKQTNCTKHSCNKYIVKSNINDCKRKPKTKIINVRNNKCQKLSRHREEKSQEMTSPHQYKNTKMWSHTKLKSKLSPTVQQYVNELLQMSEDATRTVKFSALHCSTVSTPGSSIVNVSTNVDPSSSQKEDFIETKINEIITKNLINHLKKHKILPNSTYKNMVNKKSKIALLSNSTPASSDTAKYVKKGVGDVPQLYLSKRRVKQKHTYRHKIKSLNIPKNIFKFFQTNTLENGKRSIFDTKQTSSDTGPRSSEYKGACKDLKSTGSKPTVVARKLANKCPKNFTAEKIAGCSKTYKSKGKVLATLKKTNSTPNEHTFIDGDNKNEHDFQVFKEDSQNNDGVSSPGKTYIARTKSVDHSPPVKGKKSESTVKHQCPNAKSKQTNINSENLVFIAEQKLLNMEKIADLTEKCTKRLSNLAKVLDEVRKHKSSRYHEMCSPDNSCNHTSTKHLNSLKSSSYEDLNETLSGKSEITQNVSDNLNGPQLNASIIVSNERNHNPEGNKSSPSSPNKNYDANKFVPILSDIPKPETTPSWYTSPISSNDDKISNEKKLRPRPPPALCRVNLKNEETVVPHELSTVLEVDSPMSARNASSIKLRSKVRSPININVIINSENQAQCENSKILEQISPIAQIPILPAAAHIHLQTCEKRSQKIQHSNKRRNLFSNSPTKLRQSDLGDLQSSFPNLPFKEQTTITDNSKLKMIDLNKFNEIMLKPFISIEEYARQLNVALIEEATNLEEDAIKKNNTYEDEDLSSLNSDGSLPDIISELLKRKIISEPFDFDAESNLESNKISSESVVSLLALSKTIKQDKKAFRSKKTRGNGNRPESLGLSTKNDLEKVFEDLGFRWASSTLKKTKETLALSSSTSTVSSTERFKCRRFKNVDKSKNNLMPQMQSVKSSTSKTHSEAIQWVQTTTTATSVFPHSEDKENICCEQSKMSSKHSVELQTSLPFQQPVSVKEFLANSLADKITFSCKSPQPNEEAHFSSLYSTKLTTDQSLSELEDKHILENELSGQNTRQRTSTPVQLFKSVTYNSSSSSYSNSYGLFSNIDDISSVKNGSSSEKIDFDLTIPNLSLKIKKPKSDCSGSG